MADRKISDLTALTTPATGDLLPIVDISEATAADKNKSITVGELLRGAPDGTAAAPGIAFESDGGNGMFLGGTDILAFSTGGTQAVTIDASQRVGIGTSSPTRTFQVQHSSNAFVSLTDGTDEGFINFNSNQLNLETGSGTNIPIDFSPNGSTRMRLDSSGRLGVGTTSPDTPLQIYGASGNLLKFQSSTTMGTAGQNMGISFVQSGNVEVSSIKSLVESSGKIGLTFSTYNSGLSEALRIDSSGRVGIGTSSPSSLLSVYQSAEGEVANFGTSDTSRLLRIVTGTANSISGALITLKTDSAEGEIAFGTGGGTERVRIDNSGNVGIGTTSPGYKLSVQASAGAASAQFTDATNSTLRVMHPSAGVGLIAVGSSQHLALGTGYAESARIDSSGRLLVGTSSAPSGSTVLFSGNSFDGSTGDGRLYLNRGSAPSDGTQIGALYYSGNAGADAGASLIAVRDGGTWTSGSSHPTRLVFSTTADGASSPTERMRINSSGNTFIGTGAFTTNTCRFEIASSTNEDYALGLVERGGSGMAIWTRIDGSGSSTNAVRFFDGPSGNPVGDIVVNSTSTSYNTSSDYRLKENVVNLDGAIERVKQLAPKRFNFIVDADKTVDGFLAHEAQAVVPEAVTGTHNEVDDDGNPVYQGIDQSKLVPLLTAALQEAIAKIETLEAKVAALEAN